eukprot:10680613-Lingulodinium_polyedra.AAC.1
MVEWGLALVQAVDGELTLSTTEGGKMGHRLAPPSFVVDYTDRIAEWNLGIRSQRCASDMYLSLIHI